MRALGCNKPAQCVVMPSGSGLRLEDTDLVAMSESSSEMPPHCLRCKTAELVALDSPRDVSFFECPRCHRNFTRRTEGALFFRWGHPITLLLYPVIFESRPVERCEGVVSGFVKGRSSEILQRAIEEIRLELNEPTQQVRDTLNCCASEQDLRAYLHRAVDQMEARIGQGDVRSRGR